MVKGTSATEPKTIETTVHLKKILHKKTWKKRAPRAIRAIKAVAERTMHTKEVKIDSSLAKFVWHRGIRAVPTRVRIRMQRKRQSNAKQAAKTGEMMTVVSFVDVPTFSGLLPKIVDTAEEEEGEEEGDE